MNSAKEWAMKEKLELIQAVKEEQPIISWIQISDRLLSQGILKTPVECKEQWEKIKCTKNVSKDACEITCESLFNQYRLHMNKWAEISKFFPNTSYITVRNRFFCYVRKGFRRMYNVLGSTRTKEISALRPSAILKFINKKLNTYDILSIIQKYNLTPYEALKDSINADEKEKIGSLLEEMNTVNSDYIAKSDFRKKQRTELKGLFDIEASGIHDIDRSEVYDNKKETDNDKKNFSLTNETGIYITELVSKLNDNLNNIDKTIVDRKIETLEKDNDLKFWLGDLESISTEISGKIKNLEYFIDFDQLDDVIDKCISTILKPHFLGIILGSDDNNIEIIPQTSILDNLNDNKKLNTKKNACKKSPKKRANQKIEFKQEYIKKEETYKNYVKNSKY